MKRLALNAGEKWNGKGESTGGDLEWRMLLMREFGRHSIDL